MANLAYGTLTITNLSIVTSVDVYYYNSTSPTNLLGDEWSTDTPTWTDGKYVWSKTVTTWEQNVTTQSEPVCITGQKGSTGAAGQSVTRITQQYALSSDPDNAPTTGWDTTMQPFETGKYYWTRSEIVWANPTSTTYTTAVLANGITSANTTAATANSNASAAVATANSADAKADSANQTAQNAVSIANGKNTIYYSSSKPTGGTYKAGDTWFFLTDDGYKLFEYDTTSSDWVQKSMDGKAITAGTITAAQIQAGAIVTDKIDANAITSNKLATDAIKSSNYVAGTGTTPYSGAGTFLNLSNGNIYSPNFGINNSNDAITDGAYIKGSIYAYDGTIGSDANNYWQIGNYGTFDQSQYATIRSHGNAFMQLGDTSTWRISTNRIHTAWYDDNDIQNLLQLHYITYDDKYWDLGSHIPTSTNDKFIYIRNASTTKSLAVLQGDLEDNSGANAWSYQFYITRDGNLYAKNFYLLDGTQIAGSDGVYLLKSGGTITGALTINSTLQVKGNYLDKNGAALALQTNLNSTTAATLTGNTTSTIGIGVTGTLSTSNGGTGNTSYNAGGVVYADNSSPKKLLSTAAGTSGYLLKSGGTGAPAWVNPGTLTVAAATKATQDGSGNVITSTYMPLSGGTFTGQVTIEDSLIVQNGITGDLTGKVNGFTLGMNVPSGSKLTDTVTTVTTSGTGNVITSISATNGAITAIKGNTFLTTQTDPIFSASVAASIKQTDINNWNSKTNNVGTVTSVRVQASSPLQSSDSSAQSGILNTTLSFSNQNANIVLAGPTSGTAKAAPTFRALVAADIPSLTKSKISDFPTSLKNPNSLSIKIFNGSSTATTTTYDGSVSNQNINVAGTNAITNINSTVDGKLQLTLADGSQPDPISIKITATTSDSASMANKLNLSQNVGSVSKPVYFDANTGLPKEISYTIQSNVPENAIFTDTKYSAGTGLSLSGTTFNHSNSITAGTVGTSSATSSTNRTITIPYITYDAQGHITASGTHTHTLDSFPEAYLSWGGKNFSASYSPIDAAMVPELGANRLAFLKASGITVEYSVNGGSTWTNYNLTNVQKTGIFAKGINCYLGNASTKENNNINNQLKITIDTTSNVYTVLNKIAIYMTTNGNTTQVKIEKATHANPTSFSTHLDWTDISGWSGWNILNISDLTTYGNNNSQYQIIVFTFKQTAINTNYPSAIIKRIMGFGGAGWIVPSNMATDGHLYNYDNEQNAIFPAQITATQFNGPSTELINKTLDSLTINSTAGSFTFQGNGVPWDGTDWVGLQVGSNNDKFQIHALNGTTLEYRQNDSGGTNSNWGNWYSLLSTGNYTNYTVKKDGTGATGSWGISITGNAANVTGTIAVENGGTGTTSFTSGALLIGNGTGAIGTRTIKNLTGKGNLGWTNSSTDIYIPTVNTLAYWDGRYNNSSSNLTYCIKGEFGDAAIKGVVTTLDTSANLPTAGAVSTAISTALGDYVTLTTQQTVSGRKTFQNLATTTFKGSIGSEYCNINYDQTLNALVFSFG